MKREIDLELMRQELPFVFDVSGAKAWLSKYYKAPLEALSAMEKKGVLVRLKRGLYAFN